MWYYIVIYRISASDIFLHKQNQEVCKTLQWLIKNLCTVCPNVCSYQSENGDSVVQVVYDLFTVIIFCFVNERDVAIDGFIDI